jgi:hypothetical protein
MITVGTPGLGVRQPHGVLSRSCPDGESLGWRIIRMEKTFLEHSTLFPWSFHSISLNIPPHFLEGFTPLP